MHRPKLILLCDDEPHILHILGLKLRQAGYEVITAANGEEGLAVAMERQPDLIVTDYQMPKLDGIALCRAVRECDGMQRTALILLTGCGHQINQNVMESLGLAANLSKPFSPRELIELTQEMTQAPIQEPIV